MTGRRGLLETDIPVVTAVTRLDFLSRRDSAAAAAPPPAARPSHSWTDHLRGQVEPLDLDESLELLDLGVGVARQAYDAQHRGVRAALRAGASWERIGAGFSLPFAGLHIVEATKQLYRPGAVRAVRRASRTAPVFIPAPAPASRVTVRRFLISPVFRGGAGASP